MMGRMFDWELHEFFRKQRDLERRARYARMDPRRLLAYRIEHSVAGLLIQQGYRVNLTGKNARFDVLVDGVCRIEVKAARWHQMGEGGGRYQANIHNRCDVVVFCCVNGSEHYFVIPAREIGDRRNIAVWSYHPSEYQGQWAPYLEHWESLAESVEAAKQQRFAQLALC